MSAVAPSLITDRRSQRWLMACAAMATFMGTLDEFIVNVSLPTISKEFGIGTSQAAWIVMAYLLVITSTLVLFGKIADRYGIRRLFLAGYVVFVVGSLLCGLSWSFPVLIAARVVQGIGASILRVVAYALVVKLLPEDVRGWGYGILSTASALGIVIGTPVGGLLTGLVSWHWIFIINVPIGVVALLLARRIMPPDEPQAQPLGRLDWTGVVLMFLSFTAVLWAVNNSEPGTPGHHPTLILGLGIGLLLLFVWHERRTADPLVDLGLFRIRGFALGSLAMFLACMYMTGDGFLMPFFLHLEKGLTPATTGLLLLVYSLTYVPTAQVAGRMSDRVRPYLLCFWAMVSGALACLWFVGTVAVPGLWAVVIYLAWAAASCAMFISPCNNTVMSHAPKDQKGSAAGVLSTSVQFGSAMGVVAFDAVFSFGGERIGSDTVAELAGNSEILVSGFRYSYLLGAVVCLAAAYAALKSGRARSARPMLTSA